MSNDGGRAFPVKCAWCDRLAHIRQGRLMLCATHYRISSMRSRARRDGKHTPNRREIEALITEPLTCSGCQRQMNWLRVDGASTQVTLQHDRGGSIRLLCLGCNTRHAAHPDDSFYSIPAGSKWCPGCRKTLLRDAFSRDRSRPIGLKSRCRQCVTAQYKKWNAIHANS